MKSKLRILYVSPCEPLPNGAGSNKRSGVALDALTKLGDVFYFCAPTSMLGPEQTEYLEWQNQVKAMMYGGEIWAQAPDLWRPVVTPGRTERLLKRAWITAGEIFTVSNVQAQNMVYALQARFGEDRFDIIYFFQAHSACYMANAAISLLRKNGKILIDWDAAERPAIADQYRFRGNSFRINIARIFNDFKLARFEKKLMQLADVTICAASYDTAYFESLHPVGKVEAVFNCTVVPDEPLPIPSSDIPFTALFVGLINYWPNRHGLNIFLEEIWPKVRIYQPDAVLKIVGRGVTPDIQKWHGKNGVNVIGAVDALEPYYATSHVAVAPMKFSVGSSIKILEALSFNRPVVAFEAATKRHGLTDGEEVFTAINNSDFAEKLILLANNPDVGKISAGKGYHYVKTNFSKSSIVNKILEVVQDDR